MNRHFEKSPSRSKLFDALVIKSWWVVVFLLFALFIFESAYQKKCLEEKQLKHKLSDLQREKANCISRQKTLDEQILSLDDPNWIELVLKKELGLVSEGETKILFLTAQDVQK